MASEVINEIDSRLLREALIQPPSDCSLFFDLNLLIIQMKNNFFFVLV